MIEECFISHTLSKKIHSCKTAIQGGYEHYIINSFGCNYFYGTTGKRHPMALINNKWAEPFDVYCPRVYDVVGWLEKVWKINLVIQYEPSLSLLEITATRHPSYDQDVVNKFNSLPIEYRTSYSLFTAASLFIEYFIDYLNEETK